MSHGSGLYILPHVAGAAVLARTSCQSGRSRLQASPERRADATARRTLGLPADGLWVGAISSVPEGAPASPAWTTYISVDDADATAAAYGANLNRLRAVKQQYDPHNLFRSRRGLVD